MQRMALIAGISVCLMGSSLVQLAWSASDGDELEAHLAAQRRQMDDPKRTSLERGRIALDMAATLDRAAQTATTAEERRARWKRAAALLDEFNGKEPQNPQKSEVAFQAGVYVWAQAQSYSQQAELSPSDRVSKSRAIELFDKAIERLRSIGATSGPNSEALDQNRQFRLAQAIADRDRLTPDGNADKRRTAEEQAVTLLERPFLDPVLQGFAYLLRADLLGRLGRFEKANAEVKAAGKLKPPPPAPLLVEAQMAVALGQKRFDEALKIVDKAAIDDAERGLLAIRCRVAERAELPPGPGRVAAETDAFRRAEAIRDLDAVEVRLALIALARAIDKPESSQLPEAWDLLAEGSLGLGELKRAGILEIEGANLAEVQGRNELAASLRNRAGAIAFQAQKFAEASDFFTKVFHDPQAGVIRPKAGMLRILALGRGLELGQPGCTQEVYADAIREQLRDFPNDPSAGDARWLLGKVRSSTGEQEQAISLWKEIPHGHPRWLDARLAVAQVLREELDTHLINEDEVEATQRMNEALRFLADSRDQTHEPTEQAEIDLCRARLQLTPGAGHPESTRAICESLLARANLVELHDRARRLRIVALADLGRFVDAEREVRAEVDRATVPALLDLTRLLDRSATATDSDLVRRRLGQLMRVLITRIRERMSDLPAASRDEARLREIRALLFGGNLDEARRNLGTWSVVADSLTGEMLDDLADTYVRLDAFPIAVDVYRLRAQHSRPGSLPWFRARYGLALSYYRSGKQEEARRLIEATAILHPDLGGGGALRGKFEHLRQRLQRD
jgi:tetratricopeptide (TPR) repeat protein